MGRGDTPPASFLPLLVIPAPSLSFPRRRESRGMGIRKGGNQSGSGTWDCGGITPSPLAGEGGGEGGEGTRPLDSRLSLAPMLVIGERRE